MLAKLKNRKTAALAASCLLAAVFIVFLAFRSPGGPEAGKPVAPTGEGQHSIKVPLQEPLPAPPSGPPIGPDGQPFEETLTPSFAEHVLQADFALTQTMQRLGLPYANLRLLGEDLRDEQNIFYRHKVIEIQAGPDLPLFINTLRAALLAWAENAVLLQQGPFDEGHSGGEWVISLDGLVTHNLHIRGGSGAGGEEQPDWHRPRLAIVVDDIGESVRHARLLLNLDYPVTFALWPHGTHARKIAGLVKAAKLDVLIHQPMEPMGYPGVNPGPGVLLAGMTELQVLSQLDRNLRLIPEAIGLNNHMGSRLTQDEKRMALLARALKNRNLLVLDSLTHPKSRLAAAALAEEAVTYRRDVFIDVEQDKDYVLGQLRKAEKIAMLNGQAVAIGHPLPATLEALQAWEKERDPRVQLVRLSDLAPLKK